MPAPSGDYYQALQQLMQNANVQPGARGSGFADIAYWNDKGPSQYDRLAADLQGRGSDNPEGTPGSGPWQSSGQQPQQMQTNANWSTQPVGPGPQAPMPQPPMSTQPLPRTAGPGQMTDPWAQLTQFLTQVLGPQMTKQPNNPQQPNPGQQYGQ